MLTESLNIPNDISQLRVMVSDLHNKLADSSEREKQYEIENNLLREQVRILRFRLFGRKSEKYFIEEENGQGLLFDDVEIKKGSDTRETESEEQIEVKSHSRKKKGGRKPLPDDLPREEIIHDLPEKEKVCGCGCQKVRIGEDTSEQLEMEPPRFFVKRHIRYKYACKNCEGVERREGEQSVSIAPPPVQLIPKSIATASLLAHIVTSKFSDSIPLYRQERQFKRYGIEISRGTMCNWLVKVWRRGKPLLELLRLELLSGPLIGVDETRHQVLKEKCRAPSSQSYMWVFRGGNRAGPVYYFHYNPSHSGEVAAKILKGYKGFVQTDGYGGYDFLERWPGVTHAGCWSHTRRKFTEVKKAVGKKKTNNKADKALRLIGKLYQIEREASELELPEEQLVVKRQAESKPIVEEYEQFIKENVGKVLPKSLLGGAILYSARQLPRLKVFLDNGMIPLDTNLVENAIRPFAVGRKNWLFNYHEEGANASGFFYSLIETAKANSLEPYRYLLYMFDRLPYAETTEDYKKLLPQYLAESQL